MFELPELVNVGGNGGAAGIGGAGSGPGGAGGGPPGGTANTGGGGVGGDGCPGGQKLCGGDCVDESPDNGCGAESCEPCATPERAQVSCNGETGECRVDSCEVGYADCNGDTVGVAGAIDGDGCEYSFGTIVDADTSAPLDVPFRQIRLDDHSREDWQNIPAVPAYALEEPCRDCERDDNVPPIVSQNEPPPPSDLTAYFRVAWDRDFFYVLAEAYDDNVFDAGASITSDGLCTQQGGLGSALCEDAFSIFFDGRNDGGFSSDDHRVFIGLSGKFIAPAQGQPPPNTVALSVLPSAPRCYRMEARFDWKYIVGTQGQDVPGQFPPEDGQSYGFDVAVNDWDPALSDPSVMERQSHIFWKNPGNRYQYFEGEFGKAILSSGGDAGAGVQ